MNKYTEQFENKLMADSTEVFGNFASENANHIILRLIESAQESVSAFIDRIPDDSARFYEAIKAAAANIVRYNPKKSVDAVRIITVDGKKHPELVQAAEETNTQLRCKVVGVVETRYNKDKPLNTYVIVDHKRYRLEDSHKPFVGDPPEILKSEVSCNNPTKAVIMESSFNRLWTAFRTKGNK